MESDEEPVDMEQSDSVDGEEWKELHQAIRSGDIEFVRRELQNDAEGEDFSYECTSALYLALSREQYDIASYLIHRGATYREIELYSMYSLDMDLRRLNYLLLQYNRKTTKSCVFQLISWSQSPQGLEGNRLRAVTSLYEDFYKSEILKLIMTVLEEEEVPIVYDFESEDINRVHRFCKVESEIYGLTLTNDREIFVGAKNLLSDDSRKRAKVYGVVAEEFCHLALTMIFHNNAEPYREEDSELKREFKEIVRAVEASIDRSCHVESVIKDVYANYEDHYWESELIARVPHVIGIYGEVVGRTVMESRELSRLFAFYMDNVHPKCRECTDPRLNTKAHRLMEQVLERKGCISFEEKKTPPLKGGFPSFRKSLVDIQGVSVITTNSAKICTVHIYHELKREFEGTLEKNCAFLSRKRFEEEKEKILDALRGRSWKYVILVLDKEDLSLRRLTHEFLDEFEEFERDAMNIVVISASHSLGSEFDQKTVKYKWNDLTDDFKALQQEITYLFKGEEKSVYIAKEKFQEIFSEEEIIAIVSGNAFEVCDGGGLYSKGYNRETYIEREFQVMTVDKEFFEHLPSDTSVFLCGLTRRDFKELQMNDRLVQWLGGPDDYIQSDKSSFIDNIHKPMTYKEFVRKTPGKTNIWVQYDGKVFYVRYSELYDDVSKQFVKQKTSNEKEMLNILERKKIVLISDNAGHGKSTVISNLISVARENIHSSWLWRIDFNLLSLGKEDPLSLANVDPDSDEEDVLDYFFLILGLNTGFEKHLFKQLSKYGQCFAFFDGFDEIPSKFIKNALKLLSFVIGTTDARIIVTTRKHYQWELEEIVNRFSHHLVPFSGKDQLRYLDKFWKNKLKAPNGDGKKDQKAVAGKIKRIVKDSKVRETKSEPEYEEVILALEKIQCENNLDSVRFEIDNMDFTKLAQNLIDKTSLVDGIIEFTGIPLHLNIIGNIFFNGNFKVEIESDIFHLYSQFIEQKILIFVEEKEGVLKEGKLKDGIVKLKREDAYRIHMELAFHLMEHSEVCSSSELNEDDLELCSALGIVYIHSGRIHFVHQTFADFFLAEHTRKTVGKDALHKIVSKWEFNVVRRFLSSALRRRKFENVQKEFFRDGCFFVNIWEWIFYHRTFYDTLDTQDDVPCCFFVVKILLEEFEKIDVKKDLVDIFTQQVHGVVESQSEIDRFKFCYAIGGCFTVNMLKGLLKRDFIVYSTTIFSVVRYSESAEELIDFLREYLSIKTAGGWWFSDSFKRINCADEERDAVGDSCLDLMTLKDYSGVPFLLYLISNERAGIFVYVLKFFRDCLGEERFVTEFAESKEYTNIVRLFVENVSLKRICSTFEALHSVLGDKIGNILDKDLKFWTVLSTAQVDESDGPRKSFENAIGKSFEVEKLKEHLLSKNVFGDYLRCMGNDSYSITAFMKCLQDVERTLDDVEKMKLFLKSTDRCSGNIFHLALERNLYLNELVSFYKDRIDINETRDMLSSFDINGRNAIHYIFQNNSSKTIKNNLEVLKEVLGDDGRFVQLLKSSGCSSLNLFHFVPLNKYQLDLSFLTEHLSHDEITDLFTQREDFGQTFLHYAAGYSLEKLLIYLEYADEMLQTDRSRFEALIFTQCDFGNTFLHNLGLFAPLHCTQNVSFKQIFEALKEKLSHELFRRLLKIKNTKGQTFLRTDQMDEVAMKIAFKDALEPDLFGEVLQ